jgi:hypothetical protein
MNWISLFKIQQRVFLIGAVLTALVLAGTQSPPNIEESLRALTSLDLSTREKAFYDLIAPVWDVAGSSRTGVANLLRAHPAEAERLKVAFITALELAGNYRQQLEKRNENFDEAFSEYYANLVGAVAALRDSRSLKGLLGAIDTGGMARRGLADLGPVVVDAVIERSRASEVRIRSSAIGVLGECLQRQEAFRANPEAVAKARRAIVDALDDPDLTVRSSAASSSLTFRDDPDIRARLEAVSSADAGAWWGDDSKPRFLARGAATDILAVKDDQLYYVTRQAETHECRIQQSAEALMGVRSLGPYTTRENATFHMCNHYDDTAKDPTLCWSVQPKNACRQ